MAESVIKNFNSELIWTNPNPYALFDNQNVSIDVTKYKFLIISFFEYPSDSNRRTLSTIILPTTINGNSYNVMCPLISLSTYKVEGFSMRGVVLQSQSSIHFYNAHNAGGINNGQAVPFEIYGVR